MSITKIDAIELLQSLDDKSVDLILTDPPYYKLLKEKWDNQWKTKDDYLNWLGQIIKECQRVLKDNGSFYMFCSAEMSWYIEGVIRKYFNVLNHIRWSDKESWSKHANKESLRRYINNSEEIIFAEQFIANDDGVRGDVFEPIRKYLNEARIKANLTVNQTKEILNVSVKSGDHYFTKSQWELPTETKYNKLKEHMDKTI